MNGSGHSRRDFLQRSAGMVAAGSVVPYWQIAQGAEAGSARPGRKHAALRSNLVVNDDGYVFLFFNDNLRKEDLRRHLQSYCREGVGAVAYCVGDMSWPTFYPTQVGVPWSAVRGDAKSNLKMSRSYRNVENFASESGGYFGTVFDIIHGFGKKAVASFRMNDAHFTTDLSAHSELWKQHAKLRLGKPYGYYGNCLNYEFDIVRSHFQAMVKEFVELYPEIDGIELDAMRSPFFFPPGKGKQHAPLLTEMIRDIKATLRAQAKRLKRPEYLLTTNVPLTPELALSCGLDVATWDAEELFDYVSVGTYQAYMNHPMQQWKEILKRGTPVYAYLEGSPQTGQYYGLEEYRAAAANAHASGADGIYLFNYPCLFELLSQVPRRLENAGVEPLDLRYLGQPDLTTVAQVLDEMARPDLLQHKDKHFLFYWSKDIGYRHNAPDVAFVDRGHKQTNLKAVFRCYEDYDRAKKIALRFKIENVARTEQFEVTLNGRRIDPQDQSQSILYASNGRDTRIHTVNLGPYFCYDLSLKPGQLEKGENTLQIKPTRLEADLVGKIHLVEIELTLQFG